MFGQSPGELHDIGLAHRIGYRYAFLFREIMVKLADTVEIAVDRLGL